MCCCPCCDYQENLNLNKDYLKIIGLPTITDEVSLGEIIDNHYWTIIIRFVNLNDKVWSNVFLSIENITDTSATITGHVVYKGSVNVNFTLANG